MVAVRSLASEAECFAQRTVFAVCSSAGTGSGLTFWSAACGVLRCAVRMPPGQQLIDHARRAKVDVIAWIGIASPDAFPTTSSAFGHRAQEPPGLSSVSVFEEASVRRSGARRCQSPESSGIPASVRRQGCAA